MWVDPAALSVGQRIAGGCPLALPERGAGQCSGSPQLDGTAPIGQQTLRGHTAPAQERGQYEHADKG
jgi:hypothetical protein